VSDLEPGEAASSWLSRAVSKRFLKSFKTARSSGLASLAPGGGRASKGSSADESAPVNARRSKGMKVRVFIASIMIAYRICSLPTSLFEYPTQCPLGNVQSSINRPGWSVAKRLGAV
jgi:hypothetical protein